VTRIAFLGPRATFTEQALRTMPEAARAELVPCAGSPAVLAAVRDGSADAGCVPIENSVEGAVPAVLDGLVADPPLVIVREALLAVRFALLVRPGTRIEDVRTIASHPHGIAQTREWIAARLPDATVLLSASTSEAAAQVARGEFDAAVSAPLAAEQHGLEILADDIADNAGAVRTGPARCSACSPSSPCGGSTSPASSPGRSRTDTPSTGSTSTARGTSPSRPWVRPSPRCTADATACGFSAPIRARATARRPRPPRRPRCRSGARTRRSSPPPSNGSTGCAPGARRE
jgi:prephenate dehydratase